jgi:hypothetical protein
MEPVREFVSSPARIVLTSQRFDRQAGLDLDDLGKNLAARDR